MNQLMLKARAKINLTLDVVGKRENGYHDLQMVMQTINLYDTIKLRKTKTSGIHLSSNYAWLPTNEKNIAYRAAQVFFENMGETGGIAIEITKRIPVAAGLAGGSTDAAATLIGLNRLFHTQYSLEELMKMGLTLGADVPFCLLRGTVLAEGIGEILTPLKPMPQTYVVLVKPPISVSTATVYKNLVLDEKIKHPDTKAMLQAIDDGDKVGIGKLMGNVLESVTIPMHTQIQTIKEDLLKYGAIGSMMSGSGSTVFGLFEDMNLAQKALRYFKIQCNLREAYITTTYVKK